MYVYIIKYNEYIKKKHCFFWSCCNIDRFPHNIYIYIDLLTALQNPSESARARRALGGSTLQLW